jgi:hypothetical protein
MIQRLTGTFASDRNFDPLVVPGNHMAMLTRPDVAADALISVL